MCKKHYIHLSRKERAIIEEMRKENKSVRLIALRLDRSASTISREIRRNSGLRGYRHSQAHRMSQVRQLERPRHTLLTDAIKEQVYACLKRHWSPEQIAGRWKYEAIRSISYTTLYRWIHKDRKSGGDFHHFLRNQGSRYGHGYGRKPYAQCIPHRVGIEHRPAIVEQRTRLGNWEADTMHGARHQGFLVTLVERTTRFTLIAQVNHKEKRAVQQAIASLLQPIKGWVHTIRLIMAGSLATIG